MCGKLAPLVLFVCLSLVSPACAGLPEGAAAYSRGEYASRAYSELKLIAEQGNAEAQWYLGVMFHDGQGFSQDFVQAHMWFDLAAASGDPTGVKSREIIAAKMTPSQIAEAQRLSREWKPKGRDQVLPRQEEPEPATGGRN
ncbi:MAG: hypothetical protein ACLQVJ_20105 [Syntrophobacteraceae bacterium]